ncbi:MAG: LacI family transcriptional regulator [Candidatus Cloacimonetes bacterium]|nr:LacI family transcriptional regulator [Candidatus Cloacimonadota bacterium]
MQTISQTSAILRYIMSKEIKKRTTIKDIATALNIHNSTVSRALQDHPDINPETKEKVLNMAKEMHYFPNAVAQRLKTNKTFTIGVVVPDLSKPFFAQIIHSIIEVAAKNKYQTIITVSLENPDLERENIKTLISERVDGMLVCTTMDTVDLDIFDLVEEEGIPLVFFDRVPNIDTFSSAAINHHSSVYSAIDFIIKQGYKQIAFLAGSSRIPMGKERIQGYKDAMESNGFDVKEELIIQGCNSKKDGLKALKRMYKNSELPELIFTTNSIVAQGVYEAAGELKINIPEELGIVGFGPDKELANLLIPKLTYLRTFPNKIGKSAIKLLLKEIKSAKSAGALHQYIPVKLVINESCRILNDMSHKSSNKPRIMGDTIISKE